MKIHYECFACDGTGLYQGFMERKDEAVVCVKCGGTGAVSMTVKPYTGRKRRNGIRRIRAGSGSIIDQPSEQSWFSYNEFREHISEAEHE